MSDIWKDLNEMQPIVLKMITNSLAKDRVAHAYLFEGIRGQVRKRPPFILPKVCFVKKGPCLAMSAAIAGGLTAATILMFIW